MLNMQDYSPKIFVAVTQHLLENYNCMHAQAPYLDLLQRLAIRHTPTIATVKNVTLVISSGSKIPIGKPVHV